VAAGRQDGFWEYGLHPWDMAAGVLIVREAGGRVGKLEDDGSPWEKGTLIAANNWVYPRLRTLLAEATALPSVTN
ncbi:MAG: inositol monophosphatase family protein, partial [Pseudomonadota bacterium]